MGWQTDTKTKKAYIAWQSMKKRCISNPGSRYYSHYFARGIYICKEWKDNFYAFFVDMGECPEGYTLERIDNDKGYHPENCRWATRKEQCSNTTKTIKLTYKGITLCAADWAEKIGIPKTTLYSRIKSKLPIEKILSPVSLQQWSHGTQRAYEKYKCRCKECSEFMKVKRQRKYLRSRKNKSPLEEA